MKLSWSSRSVGTVQLAVPDETSWQADGRFASPTPGLEILTLTLTAPTPQPRPEFELSFMLPLAGALSRWTPDGRNGLPMWHDRLNCRINAWLPLVTYLKADDVNRLTFAVSETLREISIASGAYVVAGDCLLKTVIKAAAVPDDVRCAYQLALRFDTRPVAYGEAVTTAAAWLDGELEKPPMTAPESAYAPFYSTWYGYWSDLTAAEIEAECALARELGVAGLLVDDGWHTDKTAATYAAAGDWFASPRKFPAMRAHVDRVHALGLKYVPWIGTPILGDECGAVGRFASKTLRRFDDFAILDPRFPEVRTALIDRLEQAMRDWDLDGFKLDYLEWFALEGEDPALRDGVAGRDFRSLPPAIDALLNGLTTRLQAVKPDVLIEFRQAYIGPAARRYANILRVGDCPGDILANRRGIINLRLTSGRTAVHSDMLTWSLSDPPETAALQLLNSLFGTPQLSMRLAELPDTHRRMLTFWLRFLREHHDVLRHGRLTAIQPGQNFPLVFVENATDRIVAVYAAGTVVEIPGEPGKTYRIVNVTGGRDLPLRLKDAPRSVVCRDVCGEVVGPPRITSGLALTEIPAAGLLTLEF